MTKPVSRFALALWGLAAAAFVVEAVQLVAAFLQIRELQGPGIDLLRVASAVARSVAATLIVPAQLTAVGLIMEWVDQIRWSANRKAEPNTGLTDDAPSV